MDNRNTNEPQDNKLDAIVDESVERVEHNHTQQLLERALSKISQLEHDNLALKRAAEEREQLAALRAMEEQRKPALQVPTRFQQEKAQADAIKASGGLALWRQRPMERRLFDAYGQAAPTKQDLEDTKRAFGGRDTEFAVQLQRTDPARYAKLRNIHREL